MNKGVADVIGNTSTVVSSDKMVLPCTIDLDNKLSIPEKVRIKRDKFTTEIHPYYDTDSFIKEENRKRTRSKHIFKCPYDICKRSFMLEATYKLHVISHKSDTFKCEHCQKVYRDQNQLTKHKLEHQNSDGVMKVFLCTVPGCLHTSLSLEMLRQHETSQHGSALRPVLTCSRCGNSYEFRSSYIRHMKFAHPDMLPFNCLGCGKCFKTGAELNAHTKLHGNNKDYMCELCGFEFKKFGNFKRHQLTHVGRNFFCKICFANFGHSSSLTRHTIMHHPIARKQQLKTPKREISQII